MNAAETVERHVTACPVGCTAALAETGIVLPEGPLRRCGACGQLVSQVSTASYREAMARFDDAAFNDPGGRELARRNAVAERRLSAIAALLGSPSTDLRIVDVGCSRGHFVEAAARAGFRAEGVEPAPGIAAAARARGLPVRTGLLEDQAYPDGSFDAATLFEVVEHLRDPLPLLRECGRILRPGGILAVSTGNAESWTVAALGDRWDYFHIAQDPGHVSFFNPRSIGLAAQRSGFAVERIETRRVRLVERGRSGPVAYALGKLAGELLNLPARISGKGHDMLAYLRKPRS